MPTLVLPPIQTADTDRIADAADQLKWTIVQLEAWAVPEGKTFPEPVIYGDTSFASTVAPPLGIRLLDPPLDLVYRLPRKFHRREMQPSTLGEARKKKGKFVIWPTNQKLFPKKVYVDGAGLPSIKALADTTPVLISMVVEWEWMYRFFTAGGLIAAYSPYQHGPRPAHDDHGKWLYDEKRDAGAVQCVQDLLHECPALLPAATVDDVGLTEGKWGVIEFLCPAEAALFGCDEHKVLPVIRRACGA